jgi:hypothetical protein
VASFVDRSPFPTDPKQHIEIPCLNLTQLHLPGHQPPECAKIEAPNCRSTRQNCSPKQEYQNGGKDRNLDASTWKRTFHAKRERAERCDEQLGQEYQTKEEQDEKEEENPKTNKKKKKKKIPHKSQILKHGIKLFAPARNNHSVKRTERAKLPITPPLLCCLILQNQDQSINSSLLRELCKIWAQGVTHLKGYKKNAHF